MKYFILIALLYSNFAAAERFTLIYPDGERVRLNTAPVEIKLPPAKPGVYFC